MSLLYTSHRFLVMNLHLSSSFQQVENKPSPLRKIFFCFMFVPALFMTGCLGLLGSGAEPTPAPVLGTTSEQPLTGVGLLTCNQTCADQAQCGTAENLGAVVLLNAVEPSLDTHTLIVGTNFRGSRLWKHQRSGSCNSRSSAPRSRRSS